MKKTFLIFFKILFSLGLLFLVFKDIDLSKLLLSLTSVNIFLLLFAYSLFYLATILSGYKLSFILDKENLKKYIAKLNFIVIFLNNFIPGSITSDIYKGYKLKKYVSVGKITFGIFMDRISGLLVLLTFFSISGLFFIDFIKDNIDLKFSFLYIILGAIFFIIIFYLIFKDKIINHKIFKDIKKTYKKLTYKKLIKVFFLTFVIRILTPIMFYIELISIDNNFVSIPIYYVIFITTFTELINIVPITIKGYGLRELIWLTLLSPFGVTTETIAILSILIISNDLLASIMGFYFFNKEKKI